MNDANDSMQGSSSEGGDSTRDNSCQMQEASPSRGTSSHAGRSAGTGWRIDWATLLLIVSLALAVMFLWRSSQKARALVAELTTLQETIEDAAPKAGDQLSLPAELPTLRGVRQPLIPVGRPTLWVFFSVGCRICMQDLPSWSNLARSLGQQNAAFLAISLDSGEAPRAVLSQTDVDVVLATKELRRLMRIKSVPFYILISPGGRVAWAHKGHLSTEGVETLRSRLRKIVTLAIQSQ